MSESMLSVGYTKMPTTATQGLTEPMKRVSKVTGACLSCSKNKPEVPKRTNILLCPFAGLYTQPHRSQALGSRPWCLKSAWGEVEGPLP